jgi:RNA polymerase sigma-70 factor (ECF subfamily)
MEAQPAMMAMNAAAVPPDDEAALIARVRREPAAFGELYRRHHGAIARYVHRRVGDGHVTEDLVADVFVSAMQAFERYRHDGVPLRAWLYRIATNRVNCWARRERSRAMKRLETEPVAAHVAPPEETQSRELARTALLTIAPRYQAVLSLHYLEGLSIIEVAATLGCREGTVKSRLHRGREKLRARLRQRRSLS